MGLDSKQVEDALILSIEQRDHFRKCWLDLLDQSVWQGLKSQKIGATPRLQKRLLEVGECLSAVFSDRSWIPHPREQLKSALGSSVRLRDSLASVQRALAFIGGDELTDAFVEQCTRFESELIEFISPLENSWAGLLDSQLEDESD